MSVLNNKSLLSNHSAMLVNSFYKILPMWEKGEESLPLYLRSLKIELEGCDALLSQIENDAMYLTLLSTIQYFIDNPDCDIADVKRQVFKSISICKKLQELYNTGGATDGRMG